MPPVSAAWYAVILYVVALAVLAAGAWFVRHELRTRTAPPPAWALWLGYAIVAVLVVYGAARVTYMAFDNGTAALEWPGEPWGITWKGVLEIVVLVVVGLGVALTRRFTSLADWAGLIARLYLAYIFIDAGQGKLGHTSGVETSIRAYQVLPWQWAHGLATLLPFFEVGFGVLVLVGLVTRTSAAGLSMLLCVFLVAISYVWVHGLAINCGCTSQGGAATSGTVDYGQHLVRDGGYLVLATFLVIRRNTALALDNLLFGRSA
jgi:uncharacterized membrane protein YphA (DoxX/SURF4 family)